MVGSRFVKRVGDPAARATLLTVVLLMLALTGTATASSTAVTAVSADATVTGISPVAMDFPIERLGDLDFDTWLHYQTEDGTAKAGTDYVTSSGSLKVSAGANAASIPVQVFGKSAFAPDKQLTLRLFGGTGVGPTPTFAERVSFAAGGTITGKIKVADMDGDGRPDVIVPNNNAGSVSILRDTTTPGSPTPSLGAPQSFAVGDGPEVATPTDINGDGRPDLVVANGVDDDFSVLVNTTSPGASTLSFSSQQTFDAGRGPRLPVLEDINGDGRPDLILANDQFDEHAISVFFNTTSPGASTASFGPRQLFDSFAPGFVLPTDVNGDGRPDLIISSQGGADKVVVILNATPPGASTLSLGSEVNLAVGKIPNVVRAADINGDGRPDLVVANNEGDSVSVLLNGTAPGASTPSFAPQRTLAVGDEPRSVQSVDLNGDGRVDLVTGNHGSHNLSVLLNNAAPGAPALSFAAQTFEAEPIPLGLVAADLNGDGRQDLVYTRESNKVLVSLNTTAAPTAAAPSLAVQQESSVGEHPSSVRAADFNGDGKPDLVVANREDDTASVLLDTTAPGTSTPSFTPQQTFATGGAPSTAAIADFNSDGRSDLVTTDEGDDTASVLLNTTVPGSGGPNFAVRQAFATGKAPSAVAIADFNGDGRPDLVVANHDDDDASVLLNTTAPGAATPSFAGEQSFATGDGPISVATADLNGDGRGDIVVENHEDGVGVVLLNTTTPGASTPTFTLPHDIATGDAPSSVATPDLNGDGLPDLVVTNEGSASASVVLNTTTPGASTPTFTLPHDIATGDAPSSVATPDLNGDGVPDLLVTNEGSDTASVFLNTTEPGTEAAAFTAQQTFVTGESPTAVTVADLNGDGRPDAIAADGDADAISTLLDTQYAASVGPASVTGTIHYAISPLVPTRMLTVRLEGGGAGGVAGGANAISCPAICSHAFADGSQMALTATPAPGSTFAGWSGAGCGDARICRFTVGADTALAARFEPLSDGFEPLAGARLRIGKARVKTIHSALRITVRGTIADGTHGAISVRARIHHPGRWVSVSRRAQIVGGNWHTRLSFSAVDSRSPIHLDARFGGDDGFRHGEAKRRLRCDEHFHLLKSG